MHQNLHAAKERLAKCQHCEGHVNVANYYTEAINGLESSRHVSRVLADKIGFLVTCYTI